VAAMVEDGDLHGLILRLSAYLTSLLEEEIDAGIEAALGEVGRATGADRGYVMTFDDLAGTFSNSHEWVAPGIAPEREQSQGLPLAEMAPWRPTFAAGEAVALERLDQLSPGAVTLRAELERQQVESALWVPMPGPGGPLGFVGFDAVRAQRSWGPAETDLLRAAGNVIAAALERTWAAAERDRASARLRAIAALVPGVVYQLQADADGRMWFPFTSSRARDLFGVTPEALQRDASAAFERVHADDLPVLMASIERSRAALAEWQQEFRLRDAAGAVRWLRGHATPTRLNGGATLWHGLVSDVTDTRSLAEALQDREALLSRITGTLRDIVVVTDAEMRITFVSPSVERVLGFAVDEVLGAPLTRFLHEAELPFAEHHVASGFRERDGKTLVHRVVHADGSSRHFETLIHVLGGAPHERGAVFSARDVSERIAEQQRLEREVAFRTALVALTNDMLGQSLDERFYQQVLERTIALVPDAQGGSLMLQDDDGCYRFVAAVGFDLDVLRTLRLTPAELGPRSPSVERVSVHDTQGRLTPERLQVFARAGRLEEIRSTLSLPITTGGVARGYMNLDNFESAEAFAEDSHGIAEALTAQVGIALQRLQLERDLENERRRYERLASHDALTGLPNRRLFQDRLEQAVARAQRRRRQVALLYVDLDNFKDVNDSFGHEAGDALLVACAERLVGLVRAEDTVARLGGDEFAVVLLDVRGREGARLVAAKLLEAFGTPFRLRGRDVAVRASVGIALYPNDAGHGTGLMRAADVAMYQVKQSGKGAYAFHVAAP